ncbi:hypothetical protein SmJEL517_g00938 [Synchytrium microbalum]|uniref:Arrestin C-terminal-like domain-containing protein n=1 Tax=Synchytrium microbalum TaxID=1806994 RepID=A0A507CH03_9FUNG|nr:uncharacterized protein SmJEL517_g00938 [Synchytrium microbalum]TPX36925.1 hypothetical protein SmJEL517_g00938 [Synchytrium microbalum]
MSAGLLDFSLMPVFGIPAVLSNRRSSPTSIRQSEPTSPGGTSMSPRALSSEAPAANINNQNTPSEEPPVSSLQPTERNTAASINMSTRVNLTQVIESSAPSHSSMFGSPLSSIADSLEDFLPHHSIPENHPPPIVTVGLPASVLNPADQTVVPRTLSLPPVVVNSLTSIATNTTNSANTAPATVLGSAAGSSPASEPTTPEPPTPLNATARGAIEAMVSADQAEGHNNSTLSRRILARRVTARKADPLVSHFSLEMDDNRTVFLPGQRVEGHVALNLLGSAEVRILQIRFTGYILTRLYKTDTNISAHSASITLFRDVQAMIAAPSMEERGVMVPEGEYVYPFSFRMPPTNLPPSYDGTFGKVGYELTAILNRNGYPTRTVVIPLTVPSTADASDRDYASPFEKLLSGPAGFWIWKSGHLDVAVSVPRTGYASEEVIPLKIDITNHSGAGTILKDIYLKQKVTYKTLSETRGPLTEKIHKLAYTEPYPASARRVSRIVQFPVPCSSVMSPSIRTSILDVSHFMIVKIASKARFSPTLKIKIPIFIAGFPNALLDLWHTRASVDTLPAYEAPPTTVVVQRPTIVSRLSREVSRATTEIMSRVGAATEESKQRVSLLAPARPTVGADEIDTIPAQETARPATNRDSLPGRLFVWSRNSKMPVPSASEEVHLISNNSNNSTAVTLPAAEIVKEEAEVDERPSRTSNLIRSWTRSRSAGRDRYQALRSEDEDEVDASIPPVPLLSYQRVQTDESKATRKNESRRKSFSPDGFAGSLPSPPPVRPPSSPPLRASFQQERAATAVFDEFIAEAGRIRNLRLTTAGSSPSILTGPAISKSSKGKEPAHIDSEVIRQVMAVAGDHPPYVLEHRAPVDLYNSNAGPGPSTIPGELDVGEHSDHTESPGESRTASEVSSLVGTPPMTSPVDSALSLSALLPLHDIIEPAHLTAPENNITPSTATSASHLTVEGTRKSLDKQDSGISLATQRTVKSVRKVGETRRKEKPAME